MVTEWQQNGYWKGVFLSHISQHSVDRMPGTLRMTYMTHWKPNQP